MDASAIFDRVIAQESEISYQRMVRISPFHVFNQAYHRLQAQVD